MVLQEIILILRDYEKYLGPKCLQAILKWFSKTCVCVYVYVEKGHTKC